MSTRLKLINASIVFVGKNYPKRLMRLIAHLLPWIKSKYHLKSTGIIEWFGDLSFYIFDLLLLPEIYELVLTITKSRTRFLSKVEKQLAHRFFGSSIDYNVIRMNPQMNKRLNKLAHAYVTTNTVNYSTRISNAIFLHELVHVWQYQHYGSMYIFRALKAQRSESAYDYGGIEALYSGMMSGKQFLQFNFEQQGAIIEDYCREIDNADSPNGTLVTATYEYYATQLRD